MKLYKISALMLGAALLTVSCNDIDEQVPEGRALTKEQSQETNTAIPERVQATFTGMFTMMGKPKTAYPASSRADDFGFVMAAISLDIEGADMFMQDNNYNWFSVCGEYSSRTANYANPYIRYVIPYRQIGIANEVIAAFPEDTEDANAINQIAQARAIRAFDYMALAPYFQFGYQTPKDKPCVPILSAGVDYANNPRATVEEVWAYIMEDLNYAVEHLTEKRSSKDQINKNVALGLRARANLFMGNYAAAASDAAAAMEGYEPYSIAEVSVPKFYDLADHNWIWGISITPEIAEVFKYGTSASWINAFSGYSYSAGTQNTPCINILLWNKIPETDVRKGWWLDGSKHSPNWAGLTWTDPTSGASATGDDMADFTYDDKLEFLPYTNIKFGMKEGVGTIVNNNDWPLMRVEEMILIQAEALAKSGNEAQGRQILENFVKT